MTDLLSELKKKDIHLYLDNGSLRGKVPPNAMTPEIKDALQRHKTELVNYLKQNQLPESNALLPSKRGNTLPLSYAQERLWFLDQFEPGSASYNLPGAVRLIG
ncbi:MAG: hypothetical protein ABL863_06410, partial [Nitrosomonas sp.]